MLRRKERRYRMKLMFFRVAKPARGVDEGADLGSLERISPASPVLIEYILTVKARTRAEARARLNIAADEKIGALPELAGRGYWGMSGGDLRNNPWTLRPTRTERGLRYVHDHTPEDAPPPGASWEARLAKQNNKPSP